MHLAFAAAAVPELDLPGVIRLAAEHGLAIELHAGRMASAAAAAHLVLADAPQVRSLLAAAGVGLAAVWMTVPVATPRGVIDEVARVADAAAIAGSALVRLVESRPTPPAVLRAAGNAAARAGVHLTVDNQPLPNGVADLWRRLDAVDHPSVGCCLDTLHLALGGDGPSLAVPTLGSRIALVRLRQPSTDAETVHRLAGIGYDGCLSIDVGSAATVRAWLPALART